MCSILRAARARLGFGAQLRSAKSTPGICIEPQAAAGAHCSLLWVVLQVQQAHLFLKSVQAVDRSKELAAVPEDLCGAGTARELVSSCGRLCNAHICLGGCAGCNGPRSKPEPVQVL